MTTKDLARTVAHVLNTRYLRARDVETRCTGCGVARDLDDVDAPCGVCGAQTTSTAVVKGTTRLTRSAVRGAREQDTGRAPKEDQ